MVFAADSSAGPPYELVAAIFEIAAIKRGYACAMITDIFVFRGTVPLHVSMEFKYLLLLRS
jgi:hypothetical protein